MIPRVFDSHSRTEQREGTSNDILTEGLVQRDKNITELKFGMIYIRREINFQPAAFFFPTGPQSLILNCTTGKKIYILSQDKYHLVMHLLS